MKKKILVVDDESEIVRLLTLRLMANNFDVICAYDGYQSWQLAKIELPDLILTDIKMPICDGINALQILRGTPETSKIPVIFMTAFPTAEIKKQLLEIGAEDFISKPFNSNELIEKINNTLLNPQKIASDTETFNENKFTPTHLAIK